MSGLGVLVDHHWFVCITLPSSNVVAPLSYHGVGVFSLYPLWHAPNSSSLNLVSFGWSVIPARRTSQKSLGKSYKNRSFPLFPPPNHTPLPLTHDPTMSHIGWHPFIWAILQFPALLRGRALFDTGLYISSSLFLDCHHVLPYYSIILAIMT